MNAALGRYFGRLFIPILLLDQVAKWLAARYLPLNLPVPVIEGFFNLTYVRNKGAAFGILAGSSAWLRRPLLILFSVAAIAFIVRLLVYLPRSERLLATALTIILGGAVGNLIDRIVYGEVIDFLDFYWSVYHWPAFNVADACITVGVLLTLGRLSAAKRDPFGAAEE